MGGLVLTRSVEQTIALRHRVTGERISVKLVSTPRPGCQGRFAIEAPSDWIIDGGPPPESLKPAAGGGR